MKLPRLWLAAGGMVLVLAAAAVLLTQKRPAPVPGAALPTSTPAAPQTAASAPSPSPRPSPTPDAHVTFDDSDARVMRVGNGYYEVGLFKSNGGIAFINDPVSGEQISLGSPNGCLWSVASNVRPSGVKSCRLGQAFRYAWSAADQRLTLTYPPDAAEAKHIAVSVTLTAAQERWFDLQISLQNDWGYPSGDVYFPAGLVFARDDMQEALLPVLPGVVLEPGFFQKKRGYLAAYPGWPGVFADFIELTSRRGSLAMYALPEEGSLTPALFGFDQVNCDTQETCLMHAFRPRIASGQSWTSPRLRVLVSAGRAAAIERLREDDGLAAADGLQAKLGDRFERLVRSPLYKADSAQLGLAFPDYPALLARLPQPGILHVVAYSPGGFDRSYPDMLPPEARFGSTAEMAEMFRQAQSMGFLVMPYTNPTWWDPQSATLQNLPGGTQLRNLAALSEQHEAIQECYGCPGSPHYGIVVSPFADFVRVRLGALMRQMTEDVPSDLVFEDQIGARPAVFDFNPAAPRPDAYLQGWVEHVQTYRSARLATEDGFDRLAVFEVGFHGSTLLSERRGDTDNWWGAGNWRYYPFGGMAAGDKVLFYQHDLAPESFTHDLGTLAWNAAMGYMLSYDLAVSDFGGGISGDWIALAADFQRYVIGQYAGERILGYRQVAENVTRTEYAHFGVTANWSKRDAYAGGDFVLPAQGVLIQKDDGSLTAGVFTSYHGLALEGGGHCLIEERGAEQIVIRQPLGNDTPLAVPGLPAWTDGTPLAASAYTRSGELIGSLPVSVVGNTVTFSYQRVFEGKTAAYYQVAAAQP